MGLSNLKMKMNEKFDLLKHIPIEIVFVTLAAIGGVARYLSRFLDGEKFSLSMLVANLFVSGFSGLMFALFGRSMGMSVEVQWVLSGVGGFMSTEALKYIAKKIKKDI